jgi:hypothetical protein
MTEILNETFTGLATGTVLDTSNTRYTSYAIAGAGATATAIAGGLRGAAARFRTAATGGAQHSSKATYSHPDLTDSFRRRAYLRFSRYPTSEMEFMRTQDAGTNVKTLRITSTGLLRVYDPSTLRATSAIPIPLRDWHRVEWHYDGSHSVRAFLGVNRHGSTPDIDLTGAGTAFGAIDFHIGIQFDPGDGEMLMDVDEDIVVDTSFADTDWIGPASFTVAEFAQQHEDTLAGLGFPQYAGYWTSTSKVAIVEFVEDVGADTFRRGEWALRRGTGEMWSNMQDRPATADPDSYRIIQSIDLTV